ncbi:hypothetical protein B0T20DRAFT_384824 [Sordaria brevicollis]|uniref:Secreted protein n=1 Tax=Sordaria brevicollis TaxID=83679 RepID=A0AAE0P2F5_SORBR|nr:hypothetical protein B0T20DRAFT_384824 [Sordaria brevicollis]
MDIRNKRRTLTVVLFELVWVSCNVEPWMSIGSAEKRSDGLGKKGYRSPTLLFPFFLLSYHKHGTHGTSRSLSV